MSASSDYLSTLSRLSEAKAAGQSAAMNQAAQIQAEAIRNKGQLWGNTIANIGQIVSQYPEQQAKLKEIANRAALTDLEKQRFQLQLQEAQDTKSEQDAIKSTLAKYNGDIDQALPEIMSVAPKTGLAFQKQVIEGREKAAQTHKTQLESTKTAFDLTGQVLGSVNDQPSWDTARKMIGGLDPSIGQQLPESYDPEVVKRLQSFGMTQADKIRQQHNAMTEYLDLQRLERGTPEYLQKSMNFFGQLLSTSSTPEEWAGHLNDAKLMGIPDSVVQQFPQAFSPEAAKQAATLAMTPEQRETNTLRAADDTRQAAAAAETARHNRVAEGIGQQRANQAGAAAAAANAPASEIKPGTADYQLAKDLASGKLTMADFNRIKGRSSANAGNKSGIYYLATQLNPDFDSSQFELGFKMAGNPQIRQRVVAINAIGPVMDRIEQLVDQSGNGGLPALNGLLNSVKFQLGNQTVTNFRQLQTLLGDEVGNALGVGTGSDLKTRLGIDLINTNLSPANFRSNIEQARTALQQRRAELYKTMGPYGGAAGETTTTTTEKVTTAPGKNPFR